MSKCILLWACKIEVQRAQKSALNDMEGGRDFDAGRQNMQREEHAVPRVCKKDKCKYCGTGYTILSNAMHMTRSVVGVGRQFKAACKLMW